MGWCGRCLLSTLVLLSLTFFRYGYGETQCTLRRGTVGSQLTLMCQSCVTQRNSIEWYELQDGVRGEPLTAADGVDSLHRLVLNISDPSTDGGKEYQCECPNTPPECHYILVNPEVNLSTDLAFVRVGDEFQITCVARSFPPPNASHFTVSRSTPPRLLTNLVPIQHGVSKVITNVSKELDSGMYTCTVNIQVEDGTSLHSSDRTTVTIYRPPYIIASTDATVYQDLPESPEQSGLLVTLECIVIKTNDAVISIEWSRNGEVLQSGLKYVVHNTTDGDVVLSLLTVRRLTEGDLGEYKCSLFSNFSLMRDLPEAEAVMSVRIDTTPTVPTTTTTVRTSSEGVSPSSSTDEVNWKNIALSLAVFLGVAIFLVIVLFVALIIFYLRRKQGYSPTFRNEPADPVREERQGEQAVPNPYHPAPGEDENERNREELAERDPEDPNRALVEADVHHQTVRFAAEHGTGGPKPSSPVHTSPQPARDAATGSDREGRLPASGHSLHPRRMEQMKQKVGRRGSAPASGPGLTSSHMPIGPQHSLPPGALSSEHRLSPTKKQRRSSTSISSPRGRLWSSSSLQRRDESTERLMTDTSQQ